MIGTVPHTCFRFLVAGSPIFQHGSEPFAILLVYHPGLDEIPGADGTVQIRLFTSQLPGIDTADHSFRLAPPGSVLPDFVLMSFIHHSSHRVDALLQGSICKFQCYLPAPPDNLRVTQSLCSFRQQPRSFDIMPVRVDVIQIIPI